MNQKKPETPPAIEILRIPISQAKNETNQWRNKMKEIFKTEEDVIKAFFIPMEDLQELVKKYNNLTPQPTGVRAYLAFTETPEPGQSKFKLLLVPATEATDYYKISAEPGNEESAIYNFTRPCPTSCADANELNSDQTDSQ